MPKTKLNIVVDGCKKCTMCFVLKPLGEFPKEKKRGYHPWCRDCKYKHDTERSVKNRLYVINLYGGKCECCGEYRYQFLCMDHQDGTTQFTRKLVSGGHLYSELAKEKTRRPGLFLSCHNCNLARGFYHICPHELERAELAREQFEKDKEPTQNE